MNRKVEVGHIPEGGGENFEQYPGGGTGRVCYKREPTNSGYLNFDLGGMSTINFSTLDQYSDSNKSPRGKPNKSKKAILGILQDTFPDHFQVKVPSAFQ